MSQSLTDILIHIVFSTKDRKQLIHPKIEEELYHYIIGFNKELNCDVLQINGVSDHIHILCTLDKNLSVSKYVNEVKSNSSRWVKSKSIHYREFAWQNGYGGFSVSRRHMSSVMEYIKMQKQHHEKVSFKEELIAMLQKAEIAYDEKYLWV